MNKRMNNAYNDQSQKRVKRECTYGEKCYRLNPAHFREFAHPHCKNYYQQILFLKWKQFCRSTLVMETLKFQAN
ncbi:unnamed protein product [Leptidea sinapis]|uniref:PBZ-type domain-containing protein n=1 Tax=Leptidea sinapis TaxID=189913 RepID=A0A5E4PM20_9NEOP|nr:unnamed protein product [Leptidea sinapis]